MTIEYALNEPLSLDNFLKIVEEGTADYNIPKDSLRIRATPMPGLVCEIPCDPKYNHSLIKILVELSVSKGFQFDDLQFREFVPGIGVRKVRIVEG
jgi:hypothetical protein